MFFFQIHLLEETSELKLSLKYSDGETWCENIVVPELKLLANSADPGTFSDKIFSLFIKQY